ncbi:hypothetical protein F3J23_11595 [Chryseobacterium sp. Tr-659]|uniref:hypothetical protein n=1 Tax=Chryseobacterium sp. Tr-659 TaxID=2608340 RepID=UPI00142078FF|nr:hypothetical protein [Chryseobacterium sp. Tr-659]NIF06083.1 hypothetical protein [Chryseobacterium sp. Tr-659]
MIIPKNLKENIQHTIDNLLKLSSIYCWNQISPNLFFILSDFNEFEGANSFERLKSRKRLNNLKTLLSLDSALKLLHKELYDLYDVTLYVFRADKRKTIIEIQYFRKSHLEPDYFAKIKDNPPMFHSKITIPVYVWEGGKFDINWESGGGIGHVWRNFLHKRKIKTKKEMQKLRKQKNRQ